MYFYYNNRFFLVNTTSFKTDYLLLIYKLIFRCIRISGVSFLIDSVRYFLPGKQSFSYYTCAGIDSRPDQNLPNKINSFIEVTSVLVYLAITLRIFVYKRKNKVYPQEQNVFLKNYFLMKLEKQSIADFATNLLIVLWSCCYWLIVDKIRSTADPIDFNNYPNYLYIYFHQLLVNELFALLVAISYYVRHPPLFKTIFREIKMMMNLVSPD